MTLGTPDHLLTSPTTPTPETTRRVGGKHGNPANLRPPWRKGQSGNPSGLTKDGRWTKAPKLEASLLAHLEKPGAMDKLAKTWLQAAFDGSDAAREQILKRLWPIQEDASQGRQVVNVGLRLELPSGAKAELVREQIEALGLVPPRPVTIDAVRDASESRGGVLDQGLSGRDIATSSESLTAPMDPSPVSGGSDDREIAEPGPA